MISNLSAEHFAAPRFAELDIKYFKNFLSIEDATQYFRILKNDLNWQQHSIKIFGKTLPQPRLTALYAETPVAYTYSGLTLQPLPYTSELKEIQQKLTQVTPVSFTHCLANLYRDGHDSMGLHADNEKELGENPVIASLSLGETRKFRLKHIHHKNLKLELNLASGSLLLMKGTTQHFWKHELPKTTQIKGPRINLTFRKLVS